MPTDFPTTLDSFTVPTSTDFMNDTGVEGDVVAEELIAAVQAVEAKVGIDSSADPTSLDYLVASLAKQGIKAKSTPKVTAQTGIATGVDIDGTEVTFTMEAGREYEFVVENLNMVTDSAGQKWSILAVQDGTQVGVLGGVTAAASDQVFMGSGVVRVEGSGSSTVKAQAFLATGSGTCDAFGSAAAPVRAYLKDIGPTV